MVKVADMLPTDPQGVLGNSVHPAEAEAKAGQMRALLEADVWEEDKARAIYSCNSELDQEMLGAVWRFLNSKERSAWKEYLLEYKRGRHADPI